MLVIRKKAVIISFVLGVLLLTAVGCITVGKQFPVNVVSQIQIGETTREEVNSLFGTPWRTGIDDGMKTWTYGHYRYSVFGDSDTRDLVLRFNEFGVVVSYTFNSTYPEDKDIE